MARLNDWSDKLEALTIAGKYGEGGANTPVNRNTMPWLYEDNKQPTEPAGKDPKEVFEQLELPLDLVQLYRMQGDGITEFWDTHPADRFGPRGASKYDKKIKEMNKWIAPLLNKQASIPESYERENIGGTLRDVMLPLLIKNYGKGPDGKYQDPDKLIEMMGKLKGV